MECPMEDLSEELSMEEEPSTEEASSMQDLEDTQEHLRAHAAAFVGDYIR